MIEENLTDRLGNKLNIGDIVKIIDVEGSPKVEIYSWFQGDLMVGIVGKGVFAPLGYCWPKRVEKIFNETTTTKTEQGRKIIDTEIAKYHKDDCKCNSSFLANICTCGFLIALDHFIDKILSLEREKAKQEERKEIIEKVEKLDFYSISTTPELIGKKLVDVVQLLHSLNH